MDSQNRQLAEWLAKQSHQDTLRFITCGSVDDGKSTLLGRLLWESGQIFEDQLAAVAADSKRYGTQGEAVDLALLVDGLSAEREQGITIDVAYRYFATPKRKFIVADTPGHEQYTRNMLTGASTAEVAVILVDAAQGLQTQTRRHAYLVSMIGVKHVLLAVNKMDTVDFAAKVFSSIEQAFAQLAQSLDFTSITAIPVSALKGDNITRRSPHTPWYTGPTLIGYLETVDANKPTNQQLIFPVQWVCRPDSSFRGLAGSLCGGQVRPGDRVRVTANGHTAQVKEIVTLDGKLTQASQGDAVILLLDQALDIARGDIITSADDPLEMTDQFEATLIWLHQDPGLNGRSYDIKLSTQWAGASITKIKHCIDVNNGSQEPCNQLALNDMSVCNLSLSRPLAFSPYSQSSELGSFILVDRFSKATVAAGLIRHNLRRAQNVHRQALSVTRTDRERLNGHSGKVIWFTGLSGSGKSTLANAVEQALHAAGKRTYILDGDNIRQGLNKDLGFTDADRVENIRRIAEVARLMLDAGLIVMTAFISPFRAERNMARKLIGEENFIEVFVDTPLEVCEERDPKGLYKKARRGELPNMTGINSPYEPPEAAELTVQTNTSSCTELADKVINLLEQKENQG